MTDQYPLGPPPDEAQDLLDVQQRVSRVLSLVARLDVGPAPRVASGPVIHAANHRSLADLLLAAGTFSSWGWPIRPLVAGDYFKKPGIGPLLRRLRCIPVHGAEALDLAYSALSAGWSVAIMPEGRVVPEKEWAATGVGRAHSGIGRVAIDTGLPVIANGASGTERFWPRKRSIPVMRPGSRTHLVLRSELVGPITGLTAREATDQIMAAVTRCVTIADAVAQQARK